MRFISVRPHRGSHLSGKPLCPTGNVPLLIPRSDHSGQALDVELIHSETGRCDPY